MSTTAKDLADHADLQRVIEQGWEDREALTHATKGPVRDAVLETIERLDAGSLRVAERQDDGAITINGPSRRSCCSSA